MYSEWSASPTMATDITEIGPLKLKRPTFGGEGVDFRNIRAQGLGLRVYV